MKPSKYITKVVMWLFFIAAIAYFSVYALHFMWGGTKTETLHAYSAEDSMDVSGYLIRRESVLEGSSTLEEVVPAEGDRVASGETLALVFDSEDAMQTHRSLEEKKESLVALQYINNRNGRDSDETQLNSAVQDAIFALSGAVASGDLSNLEALSYQLRQTTFRQDYTYNGADESIADQIKVLESDIDTLNKRSEDAVSTVTAEQSGVFSALVDGYETVLTPELVGSLMPSQLASLLEQQKAVADNSCLGKIITENKWYFVASMPTENTTRIYEGQKAQVRFNSSIGLISMKVERIGDEEDGARCVVFSSEEYLAQVAQLRDQVVDIVFDTVEGYRVSKETIRVDNTSGETGVYRVYGTQASWIPVEVLWEGEDYYLIQQKKSYDEEGNQIALTQLEEAKQLRSGAEVVVGGKNIYNGKVIAE